MAHNSNSTPPNNTTSKVNFFKSRKALLSASAIATIGLSTGVAIAAGVAKISPYQVDVGSQYQVGDTVTLGDGDSPLDSVAISARYGGGHWQWTYTDAEFVGAISGNSGKTSVSTTAWVHQIGYEVFGELNDCKFLVSGPTNPLFTFVGCGSAKYKNSFQVLFVNGSSYISAGSFGIQVGTNYLSNFGTPANSSNVGCNIQLNFSYTASTLAFSAQQPNSNNTWKKIGT